MEESSEESSRKPTQNTQKRVYPTWLCPICGTRSWVTNKRRHLCTRKRIDVLYISTERFEKR